MKVVFVPVRIDDVVESLYFHPGEIVRIYEATERVGRSLRHASDFLTIPAPDDYKHDSDVQPLIWVMHHVALFVGRPVTAALYDAHRAFEEMLPGEDSG